jgi:colanic acid/amylovoran biosynthesis protein
MKVIVLSVNDTLNYGSAMMAINLIHYLSIKSKSDILFEVDASTQSDVDRLIAETGQKIVRLNLKQSSSKGSTLQSTYLHGKNIFFSTVGVLSEKPYCIIDVGGDNLAEYYYGSSVVWSLLKLRLFSIKTKVFLAAQTIGPFYSWRKSIAPLLLNNCFIYPRSSNSYHYAREVLHLKHIFETRDLAFLNLPNQSNPTYRNNILKRYNLTTKKYVTIVPSGLYKYYTKDFLQYVESWVKIVDAIAASPRLKDQKIVLLPHVLSAHQDDRKVITAIQERLAGRYNDRILYITDVLLPSQARGILGQGTFTVSGRMHAAVSTLQMNTPVVCVAASYKFKGVIGSVIQTNDLIIDAADDELWHSNSIVELVSQKIDYLLDNYDCIVALISRAVVENQLLALAQIDSMLEKIRES